jgi:hypothetical protein
VAEGRATTTGAGHAPFVTWFIERWKPQQIVEPGVHSGNSSFAMCQAAKGAGVRFSLVGVDSLKSDVQAPTEFADGSIDLLYIDVCHDCDAVRHHYQSWLPKMSRQGVIIIHGTQVREPATLGVRRLWAEIKRDCPHCEFMHAHGLGVLFVGGELNESRQALRDSLCDPNGFGHLSSLFSMLGMAIASEREASMRSDALERHVRELTHEVELRGASLSRLHGVLEAVRAEKDRHSQQASAARELGAALAKAQAEREGVEAQLAQARSDLDSVLRSTSWRMTSPFRLLRRLLVARPRSG